MKTTWNYRIIERTHENGTITFGLYEVYWKGEEVEVHTEKPICGYFDSPDELLKGLERMTKGAIESFANPLEYEEDRGEFCSCKDNPGMACSDCPYLYTYNENENEP